MKTTTLFLILFLAAFGLQAQMPPTASTNAQEILKKIMARRHAMTNGVPGMPGFPGANAAGTPPANFPGQQQDRNFPPQMPPPQNNPQNNFASSMPVQGAPAEETVPPGFINFQGVDVNQVLEVYAQLVNRTLLRAQLPQASIVLKTQTALTKSEAI